MEERNIRGQNCGTLMVAALWRRTMRLRCSISFFKYKDNECFTKHFCCQGKLEG